jgi:integrase
VLCRVRVTWQIHGGMAWWGVPLDKGGVYLAVRKRAVKAGLGHVAVHDLRRTYCSLLQEAGVPLEDRQAAMRHSSPVTTLSLYDRRDPGRVIRAVENLEL